MALSLANLWDEYGDDAIDVIKQYAQSQINNTPTGGTTTTGTTGTATGGTTTSINTMTILKYVGIGFAILLTLGLAYKFFTKKRRK